MKIFKIANQINLNTKWQEVLSNSPESGMGYQKVDVYLKDGRVVKNVFIYNGKTNKASFDQDDIVDIKLSE